MRNLIFVLAVFFSLASVASLSFAQDGEALLAAQLPEGVTLDDATPEQMEAAVEAVVASGADVASVNAAVAVATAPTRPNAISATQATSAVVRATVARIAPTTNASPYISAPEAALAGQVIANIINTGNLSGNQVASLVTNISNITVNTSANTAQVMDALVLIALEAIEAAIDQDLDIGALLQSPAFNRDLTCTVSNSVVTCVNS